MSRLKTLQDIASHTLLTAQELACIGGQGACLPLSSLPPCLPSLSSMPPSIYPLFITYPLFTAELACIDVATPSGACMYDAASRMTQLYVHRGGLARMWVEEGWHLVGVTGKWRRPRSYVPGAFRQLAGMSSAASDICPVSLASWHAHTLVSRYAATVVWS